MLRIVALLILLALPVGSLAGNEAPWAGFYQDDSGATLEANANEFRYTGKSNQPCLGKLRFMPGELIFYGCEGFVHPFGTGCSFDATQISCGNGAKVWRRIQ